MYQYRERNKQSVTLNLKHPQGVGLFKELVTRADVVAENFSVGTMERLGLGYETLKQVNPRLIYASVTAFGQYGPYAHWRGYDILAQALSGYMSITGFPTADRRGQGSRSPIIMPGCCAPSGHCQLNWWTVKHLPLRACLPPL